MWCLLYPSIAGRPKDVERDFDDDILSSMLLESERVPLSFVVTGCSSSDHFLYKLIHINIKTMYYALYVY